MKSYTTFTGLVSLLWFLGLTAQAQDVQWLERAGGSSFDNGEAIVTDAQGNSYVTGDFQDTADFDTLTRIARSNNGNGNFFTAKYNSEGDVIWIDTATRNAFDYAITTDNFGNIYTVAEIGGGTTITLSNNQSILGSSFLVKYNSKGQIHWADTIPFSPPKGITTDAKRNIFIGGMFKDTVTLGTDTFISTSNGNPLIIKYDSSGSYKWGIQGKILGSSPYISNGIIRDLAIDKNGNLYGAGTFFDTLEFGNDTLFFEDNLEPFFIKLDSSSSIRWLKKAPGSFQEFPRGISIGEKGGIYSVGTFDDTIEFGNKQLLGYSSYENAFITKLSKQGNFQWVKQAGAINSGSIFLRDMSTSKSFMYFTGFLTGGPVSKPKFKFGNDTIVLNSNVAFVPFISKMDESGNFLWTLTAPQESGGDVKGISNDSAGNSFAIGDFNKTLSLQEDTVNSKGSRDIFTTKISDIRIFQDTIP
ncbi:MAG: hypothetical protein BRD49_00185, partial [Bacteroidetes bacterium SW_10_40_5]